MIKAWSKHLVVGTVGFGLSLMAGLASAQQLTPLTFQLNWVPGGANAGFAAAVVEGFYKDVGLDVTLVPGNGSGNTAQLVASGRSQVAYADAVTVSNLIAKGAPMKVVSTIYQSNPNAVLALKKKGINSIKDLKGRKVAVPSGSSQTAMLPLLWAANGLKESDMELLNMPPTSMVPALLQEQADAILGSLDSYQIQAEAQGAVLSVFPFATHGVPTVSTSIFASDAFIKDNPDVLRRFIAASIKGWVFALDNPAKSIQDTKKLFSDVNEKLAAEELKAAILLMCTGGAKYIGKAEDSSWNKTQQLLSEVKLLPAGQDPKSYYTNAYLPPDSSLRACK